MEVDSMTATPMGTPAPTANSMVNINTADVDKVGVFTTAQSLVTFPGAVAAVTTIWKVIGTMYPAFGSANKVVPVVLALIIGILIYLTSVSKGTTLKQKSAEVGIAVINSFTIAAAALGIG
jgi:hypothetical protein